MFHSKILLIVVSTHLQSPKLQMIGYKFTVITPPQHTYPCLSLNVACCIDTVFHFLFTSFFDYTFLCPPTYTLSSLHFVRPEQSNIWILCILLSHKYILFTPFHLISIAFWMFLRHNTCLTLTTLYKYIRNQTPHHIQSTSQCQINESFSSLLIKC